MTTKSESVLDAALALFDERTYGGTAVPVVADRAGVAVGTIYRSFPSKEALANALYRRSKQAFLDEVSRDVTARGSVEDDVAAMWAGLGRFAATQPEAFAFLEHQQHAAYLDDESRELSARVEAAAVAVIRRGQDNGEIRPGDPSLLVALVFGAFVGLTKACRQSGRPLAPHDVTESGAAVWDLLRNPDPGEPR